MHLGAALIMIVGGRALYSLRGVKFTEAKQTTNTNYIKIRSESMDDKVHGREGKSPEHQLRSQIMSKWERRWIFINNQEVGLEAAIPLKSA